MIVQKLSWAGIAVSDGETSVVIDPIGDTKHIVERPLAARLGTPTEPLYPLSEIPSVTAVLISHVHPDHFDHLSIMAAYGEDIPVLLPIESVEIARKTGLKNVIGVTVDDRFTYGKLDVTASYSVDGYGTPQVSWVVGGNGKKIIHCGDTLWHGYWWKIARQHGPIDVACLPVNGAILEIEALPQQSILHACMTPEEAVEAAKLLQANKLVPIHFNTFKNPPYYIETPNLLARLITSSKQREVDLEILAPGETTDLTILEKAV
ncbi:MBL fold metallo-hydrolase [Effusibacillus lacus]|uniref:Metallo-beta-lactamase domain-containing protein n=1 Tax=Effusibacillus lacus TaxID=1348429 RepID=A0A292YK38_9BACL|nr:MBL fold metallo-hydrolase [Effusibacillus lacus]TCS68168.1 L-ascorbate metabolism protein UlaG (beta-lactamase superfamily) [Effusibacillus lacus]GAX90298.1 hypothetical protein EFBL_1924 [Effusibacillus lacus]